MKSVGSSLGPLAAVDLDLLGLVAQLKGQLYDRQMHMSPSPGRSMGIGHGRHLSNASGIDKQSPKPVGSPNSSGISLPQASLDVMNMNLLSESPGPRYRSGSDSPQIPGLSSKGSDLFMDLLFSGWNPDLPDPVLLHH
jgi:hypothetical protein